MLQPGQNAPDFSLPDQNGVAHSLSQYRGKTVLLYFYPKDDTPGCVAEACSIATLTDEFVKLDVVVLGVSADDSDSHKKFAEKYHLPFTLLSDPNFEVIKAYGAYKEEDDTGLNIHSNRISYLISPAGVIMKTYPEVDPANHAAEILKDVGG